MSQTDYAVLNLYVVCTCLQKKKHGSGSHLKQDYCKVFEDRIHLIVVGIKVPCKIRKRRVNGIYAVPHGSRTNAYR